MLPMNKMMSHSAFVLGFAQLILLFNFFWSMHKGKKAERNPWNANTLEWASPTPGIHGNFDPIPTVYRGPYEYSTPDMDEDFLPQDKELAPAAN